MKSPTILHNLTPVQKQYYKDFEHRFFVIPPGRRSRKTLLGIAKCEYVGLSIPDLNILLGAPTHQQAKRIFWEKIKTDLAPFTDGRPNNSELILTIKNGTSFHVSGLDRPERVEGSPWDYALITETGNTKPDFWAAHLRPVFADTRRKVKVNDKVNGIDYVQLGSCIFDGTPEGRNHYYDMALKACGGAIPQTIKIKGARKEFEDWIYYSWFASDVLPKSEIEAMRRDMDERTFRQEAEGEFVSYEGTLYYNFTRENVSEKAKYNPDEPIYLSCDFNKTPMVWEVGQRHGDVCYIIDEVAIKYNAKTQACAQLFVEKYSKSNNKIVYLTGDASGRVENTRDYSTDYLLIDEALSGAGFNVRYEVPAANPNVNNRVNLACSLFKSLTGRKRCFINPVCEMLIEDFEKVIGDNKGGKDKTDIWRTHASDAFDYLIVCMFGELMTGYEVGQAKM